LLRENGMFAVLHKDGKKLVPVAKLRSITLGKGSRVSSDAVLLAIENEVDILFVDRVGMPQGRIWSVKYGSVSTIRRKQVDFAASPRAVRWIRETIGEKMENQTALLLTLEAEAAEDKAAVERGIARLDKLRAKVLSLRARNVGEVAGLLRGLEGSASKVYFQLIARFLPEAFRFEQRSQHPATDMFNAMLNYSYGMLYAKVEGALIKAGIDPYMGVFHRDQYNRPVLVYDVIEKYRVWADYVVVALCMNSAVSRESFSTSAEGGFWLEGTARRVVVQSVNDYLDELVTLDGMKRSRGHHILIQAQKLATLFSQMPDKDAE